MGLEGEGYVVVIPFPWKRKRTQGPLLVSLLSAMAPFLIDRSASVEDLETAKERISLKGEQRSQGPTPL